MGEHGATLITGWSASTGRGQNPGQAIVTCKEPTGHPRRVCDWRRHGERLRYRQGQRIEHLPARVLTQTQRGRFDVEAHRTLRRARGYICALLRHLRARLLHCGLLADEIVPSFIDLTGQRERLRMPDVSGEDSLAAALGGVDVAPRRDRRGTARQHQGVDREDRASAGQWRRR